MAKLKTETKRMLRKSTIKFAGLFWGGKNRELPMISNIRSVLIVKMWATGELVMATPAIAAIRDILPDAKITLLTGRRAAPIVANSPHLDTVWVRPEEVFLGRSFRQLNKLRRRIKKKRFDIIICMHHSWEFSLLLATVGVRHRVGFDRNDDGFAYTFKVPVVTGKHQVEEYYELATPFGIKQPAGKMELFSSEKAQKKASQILRAIRPGPKGIVVMVPGGGINPKTRMIEKRWQVERFAELAEQLNRDYAIVLGGGPSDKKINEKLVSLNDTPLVNLAGNADLQTFHCILQKASLFVGNDSAPMHLASAAGIPTITLFGPTDPILNGPWKTANIVVTSKTDCAPCYEDGYFPECEDVRCLREISVQQVLSAIDEISRITTAPSKSIG